jgi:hypothetical protein
MKDRKEITSMIASRTMTKIRLAIHFFENEGVKDPLLFKTVRVRIDGYPTSDSLAEDR